MKILLQKRGIDFGKHPFPGVDQGWGIFVRSSEVGIMSIVREFYAHVPNAVNDRAIVKGVFIALSASTINYCYGMRDVNQGRYESYLENINYEEVIDT